VSDLLQFGALACTLLGLLSGALVLAASRDARLALRVLLEFLLAAGLLRLSDDPTWRQLAVAAAVVLLRRLLSRQL
jgi:hypothetical protein